MVNKKKSNKFFSQDFQTLTLEKKKEKDRKKEKQKEELNLFLIS